MGIAFKYILPLLRRTLSNCEIVKRNVININCERFSLSIIATSTSSFTHSFLFRHCIRRIIAGDKEKYRNIWNLDGYYIL